MDYKRTPPDQSSPQLFAAEVKAALDRLKAEGMPLDLLEGAEHPKTGHRAELDPWSASKRTLARVTDCGTFPRGKVVLGYPSGGTRELGAHQCRARLCPRCAKIRGFRLAEDMARAIGQVEAWGLRGHHVRFVTLTIPNERNAAEGVGKVSAAWHRMLANKRFASMVAGGFRCFEVKPGKDGLWNVHLHAIVYLWAPGVPYQVLRSAWDTAAGNQTGKSYNQRFDELRNLAKPRQGESKATAAARYLVKYLVKLEDAKASKGAPGGLPHLLSALEGRRMFAAWGIAAAARRKVKHEEPDWTGQVNRAMSGYLLKGERPNRAELHTPQGIQLVPVPIPPMPAVLEFDELPEQIEPKAWKPRRVSAVSPMDAHRGRHLLPRTKQTVKDWLGWEDHATAARSRLTTEHGTGKPYRRAWRLWRMANPRPQVPKPFAWRPWWRMAPKEWTQDAETLLGVRTIGAVGAALWSRIKPSTGYIPTDPTDPRSLTAQLHHAEQDALRSISAQLWRLGTAQHRLEYLQTIPPRLAGNFIEAIPWHEQEPPRR